MDSRTKRSQLQDALSSLDPEELAAALDLPDLSTKQQKLKERTYSESLQLNGVDWSAVLNANLEASQAAIKGNVSKCFEAQSKLHSAFLHLFGSSKGNWMVPALHVISKNSHLVAVAADSEDSKASGRTDHAKLQSAVTLLQESFSKTLNDRTEYQPNGPLNEEGSKKAGVLYIVNQLFSMYFRLNTLRLCKNLLRPVESRKLHEMGTMGEMVTYRYYVGRLVMFEDQYDVAEQHLEYALVHCHKNAMHNKRCILKYLVPVKLFRGKLPTKQLLEKYSLHEFVPLVNGIRKGDLRTFNDGIVQYQDLFIRRGTYLLLEKCKTVCYRNLFKRVHKILNVFQIPLDKVAATFKWLGMPIDLDEVECILANLIFRGYVRGYISHAKRVLVLSKRDPFPVSAVIKR